ncbi:UDP-glucose---hexose-1-phosphate uridylyltransferase [Synchytrium endobioticum]|uniref:Galactose-1-phosphate uridylyltransferase n=1 Tax=Synchytrium endobioticum TaxID=286115 RepID=A0A507DFN9_9FUNG|nr:UDP-glucose---hexose-1-phosphate uridylyltransferase [Synchytrium endobioticum]TPX49708.1 UDP-glucose---hexose-1-phosphate uridylyltransferase [Synchytrium endobioticum]
MQAEHFDFTEHSHRRLNPLTNSWILCSPHRAKRPWLGQQEDTDESRPEYDPNCYLCPGNQRSSGTTSNPPYTSTFVFTNDFPAVHPIQPKYVCATNGTNDLASRLLRAQGVRGSCRVMCFHPRHDLTMAEMSQDEITAVIRTWIDQASELSQLEFGPKYIQVFENKGAVMGCSNPHSHCQIWATDEIPDEPTKELRAQAAYKSENNSCLLCDYVELETSTASNSTPSSSRMIFQTPYFVCLVPYWATWPYETIIIPKFHTSSIVDLSPSQIRDLADTFRRITCRYDNVFDTSFPYSMGVHSSPVGDISGVNHLHVHFYPPLLRSASVKKFLVGYEMMAEAQRDLTAEQAAERLRKCSETHYKHANA